MYTLIVNPTSGRGVALKRLREIEEILKQRSLEYRIEQASKPMDAARIAREAAAHRPEGIIAVGGDGTLFEIINGNRQADAGDYKWGVTITTAYLPLDNTEFFNSELNLVDWLSQFGKGNEVQMKSFLGRMLFKDEDVMKKVNVLSGGEKMRCMIARMQMKNAN